MLFDPLANVLSNIENHERARKREVVVSPVSKLIIDVLRIMRDEGFIGGFEFIDKGKAGMIKVTLIGKVNRCGVVRPRHAVKWGEFERWEKRYLPASGFGLLVVSTQVGTMSHREAREKGLGGRLLAYVY